MGKKKKQKKSIRAQKTYINNTPTISVCMIVKNEEESLPRALGSIKGLADEIIVVDTGSTDKTVEIAKSFGAKVYFFEWCDDFSAARNESLKHATCDYILWLDGDDEIKKEYHDSIKMHLKNYKGSGVFLKLINVHKDGTGSEAIQLRLFPNRKGVFFEGRVHEQVIYELQKKGISLTICDVPLFHYGYETNESILEKIKRNIFMLELELKEKPDNLNTHFFLSRSLKGLGRNEEAIAHLDKMLAIAMVNPNFMAYDIVKLGFVDKAVILYNMGRENESLSILEQSKRLYPGNTLVAFTLGELYYRRKEYEKAYKELLPLRYEDFKKELTPLNIYETRKCLLTYLGISSMFVKDYSLGESCFKELIDIDPFDKANYHYLAMIKEKSSDLNGAIEVCNMGIEKFDEDDSFYKRIFLLYTKTGEYDKALNIYGNMKYSKFESDALAGRFLIACNTMNLEEINYYYRVLQEHFMLEPQVFPEQIIGLREKLTQQSDAKALNFFDSAISFLLNHKA